MGMSSQVCRLNEQRSITPSWTRSLSMTELELPLGWPYLNACIDDYSGCGVMLIKILLETRENHSDLFWRA